MRSFSGRPVQRKQGIAVRYSGGRGAAKALHNKSRLHKFVGHLRKNLDR